ncbi:hypothetical protein DRW07_05395 [Alteromonas sediminis]|uniref:DUF6249 domain-containing protein n=1 Tax=Alteromonas sediminis TaxID=2259342 RepID=A0A3N5Y7Y8_9ALTE|nr:DUF6249 domain-containing protein [Alteromonas sediminis]RPJ66979.1 hypothetical protein DRW07_05395 [Alteromonas sediminis]
MSELWIPVIGIICIAVVIIASLYMGTREKQQLHTTLQLHLQNGGELSPALLKNLGANVNQSKRDLRKGLLLTAIGIACFAGGFISENFIVGAVFGVFPLFVGLAFGGISLINKNE